MRPDTGSQTEDDAGRYDRANAEHDDHPREPEFDESAESWIGGWG